MNSSGTITIKTQIDKKGFENDLDDLVDMTEDAGTDGGELFGEGLSQGAEKSSGKIKTLLVGAFSKATGVSKGLLTSIKGVVAVAGKLSLALGAIFLVIGAVIGAITLISKSIEKLYNENEQFKANIQYIVWALNKAIEPALNWIGGIIVKIINLVVQAIKYVAALIKLLTGHNIFANASAQAFADSMKQAEESSGGIAGNLKQVKKQLAGFDEKNVLNDTSGGGGGGGVGLASQDFTMPDINLDDFGKEMDNITGFIEEVKKEWKELGKLVDETPLEDYIKEYGLYGIAIKGLLQSVYGQWEIFLGQWNIVGGLYDLIVSFFTGDQEGINKALEKIWEGVQLWAKGSKDRVIGILEIIGGLLLGSAETTWNILSQFFGGIWDWIEENIISPVTTKGEEVVGTVGGFLETIWGKVVEIATNIWNSIVEFFTPVIDFFKTIWDTVESNIKITIDNIRQIIDWLIAEAKKIIEPIIEWIDTNIIKPVVKFFEDLWNKITKFVSDVISKVQETVKNIVNWINNNLIKPVTNFFKGLWDGIVDGVKTAIKWVKDLFNGVVTFFKGIIDKIVGFFREVGGKVADAIGGAFKSAINGVLGAVESILNTPIRAINGLINAINKIPGLNLTKLNTFSLPRLAQGGIVNNPGPGVMMGSYIAGERGPEAVLPLNDETFERLGIAIGKHTSINATIPVYVGNRQVVRELRKIEAENNFAFNS